MATIDKIKEMFGEKISVAEGSLQPTIIVSREDLLEIMKGLKNGELNFKLLVDLTAVDYEEHMEIVYHLMNLDNSELLRIKTKVKRENPEVDSLSELFKAAVVQEREAYDMLGIKFVGHPNLERILCPEDFEGHPLRKDFKMEVRGR